MNKQDKIKSIVDEFLEKNDFKELKKEGISNIVEVILLSIEFDPEISAADLETEILKRFPQ